MEDIIKGSLDLFKLIQTAVDEEEESFKEFEKSVQSLVESVCTERTPIRNKKKPKKLTNDSICSSRSSNASTTSNTSEAPLPVLMPAPSGRAPRLAATKANMSLKEPNLITKKRNELQIKLERLSVAKIREATGENDMNMINAGNNIPLDDKIVEATANLSIKDKLPVLPAVETLVSTTSAAPEHNMDDSIIMMAPKVSEVVMLSDSEDINDVQPVVNMPPPSMPPPPKRKGRTKKGAVVIKEEKLTSDTSVTSTRSTRSKKPKAVLPVLLPKEETVQLLAPAVFESAVATTNAVVEAATVDEPMADEPMVDEPMVDEPVVPEQAAPANINVTVESVYEDARDIPQKVASPVVVQIPAATTPQMDSTYVQEPNVNATFVRPGSGISTDLSDETFNVVAVTGVVTKPPTQAFIHNETMVVEPTVIPANRGHPSMSSIMTDDRSDDEDDENIPIQQLNIKKKELFNPCIQSPMKKKVEAFERHAIDAAQSPAVGTIITRSGRTKPKPGTLIKQPSTPSAYSNLAQSATRSFTPTGQPIAQPSTGYYSNHAPKRIPTATTGISSSTSKLAHLNRPASASKVTAVRDSNAEENKKSLLDLADEKKRKREEKLKQVQSLREAREKEKLEKLRKQMQEKEEKAKQEAEKKRLMKERKEREAESKRNIDEIQRNLKIQELKKIERARVEREMAEAARKERENLDQQRIQAERNVLQQKLKANLALKQKQTSKYNFDMLCTDDETDEDDSQKKNRPPPPQWSLRGYREDRINSQSHLLVSTIDEFFSSKPTTPDLKELFPQIQDKYLKRNSSAVWNTPPRYSTMDVPRY